MNLSNCFYSYLIQSFHNKELAWLETGRRLLLIPGNCDKLLGSFWGCSSRGSVALEVSGTLFIPCALRACHGVHLLPFFQECACVEGVVKTDHLVGV